MTSNMYFITTENQLVDLIGLILKILNYDIQVVNDLNKQTDFILYDKNDDSIHCIDKKISEVIQQECCSSHPQIQAHFNCVSDKLRTAIDMDFNCDELDSQLAYLVFSILHEIGHYDDYHSDSKRFESNSVKRDIRLKQLQNNLNAGNDRNRACKNFAMNYRNLPLEQTADRFALKLMKKVKEQISVS